MKSVGVDIGALFFKAVAVSAQGELLGTFYERHLGEPGELLAQAFETLQVQPEDRLCFSGCNGEFFARLLGAPYREVTLCQIDAIRTQVPDAKYVMDIGGASATLIQLNGQGKFQGYSTNSLCAAGTGSFLDEQAGRLGISYEDTKNYLHNPNPPTIATRCTVFAKSDLIHRQQEGCSRGDMWSGLCRGMTKTLLGTLLSGRPLDGKTLVIGGVALNQEVIRWLEIAYPDLIQVPQHPHLLAALGAVEHASKPEKEISELFSSKTEKDSDVARFPWPLSMEKSNYPSFETQEAYEDEDKNEVRVTAWNSGEAKRVYLGIDIGSTSTKVVLMDETKHVIADIYRKTSGDPIGATKLVFKAIRELSARKDASIHILGVGTTGSGRKIVGEVIGADAVINEISAHVAGAAQTDPTIDTIFEIGGQDAKYMHLVDGHIRDSNMNYVCAAGTGSFVEEQANKLGYKVSEAGPKVLGITPPRATDRCTVFMEQDMGKLIQSGASPEEAFAAVMVSVTKNYLNKVVGNRYRSRDKIFFQGATARNPALVAAFERLLDVEIVVSPYCHVMGSYGVALLTREAMLEKNAERSEFRGLDLDQRQITLRKEKCELCQNDCEITYADIDGVEESPSWGYLCGREPGEKKMKLTSHGRLLRKRRKMWLEAGRGVKVPDYAPLIGIPQALTTFTYFPLWRRFFNRLGYRVVLSGETKQGVRDLGGRLSGADFCFPAKVFLGHAGKLATQEGVDFIFLPQMKNEEANEHVTTTTFCPYSQAAPAYTKAAFELNGMDTARILDPVVDLKIPTPKTVKKLARGLAKKLKRNANQIERAWVEALSIQREFESRCREEGQRAIEEAKAKGEKLLVLVGRPYNIYDPGLNLGLPEKIAEQGRTVLPLDWLTLDFSTLGDRYGNTYWGYGQKILAALEEVSRNELFDAVYFTNFSCGPDSFLLNYASEIMGNKPFLALELDEHGSNTGYITRIEAFFDVLRRPRKASESQRKTWHMPNDFRERTIWVPNMHAFSTEFLAAALRSNGYDARSLPLETEGSFEVGRSVTRGSECLPTSLTIGSLLTVLRKSEKGSKHGFFMPTAQGPCRFGQYITLHRQILDREGFGDVPIFSPQHYKGFAGLDGSVRQSIFKGMLVGDVFMKSGCRIRPYEKEVGETNHRLETWMHRMAKIIQENGDIEAGVREAVNDFMTIPVHKGRRKPIVGVVGEIYVRNNSYANENVIRSIEKLGAEAWMTPLSEWLLYTNSLYNVFEHHGYKVSKGLLKAYLQYRWMCHWEHKLYRAASPLLDERHEPPLKSVLKEGHRYLTENTGGEALLTIGRAVKYAHQGAAMVVNVAPFSCMPGTITTALFRDISAKLHMPIVNMFYDGTGGQNRRLEVYLRTAMNSDHAEFAKNAIELPSLPDSADAWVPPADHSKDLQI